MRRTTAFSLLLLITLAPKASAIAQSVYTGLPAPLERVAFEQRLGDEVDLSLKFVDDEGRDVALGDLIDKRPVIVAPVYYDCPMLCSMTLNGLVSSLKAIETSVGTDFDVIVFSIDPSEEPALARAARDRAVTSYGRSGGDRGWHFLTAEQASIEALTEAIGFSYSYDEETGEYAHAAGIVILTPDGLVSRYLLGIEFPARFVRLALIESAEEKIGSLVDQALLFCYNYDPESGTYSAATLNFVRLAGALTVVGIIAFIVGMNRRERDARANMEEAGHVA